MGLSSFFKKLFLKEKKVHELPVTIAPEFVEAKKEVVEEEKPKMAIKKKAPKKETEAVVKKRAPKKDK